MELHIRKTETANITAILRLVREFAEYEKLLEYLEVTEENLHDVMFGQNAFVKGLVAFDAKKPIAYAFFFPAFLSFRGQKSVYLEDIFVSEKYRGRGIGEKMLREVAGIGKQNGAVRMDFQVLEPNKPAWNFYKRHGAEIDEEERHFKFVDEAFQKLAGKKTRKQLVF